MTSVTGAETDAVAESAAPALVSGRRFFRSEVAFTEESEAPGVFAQRGRTTTVRAAMSDARLTGDVVIRDNADRFFEGAWSEQGYRGDVLWGTIEITNAGGTWTGTSVGTTDTSGGGGNIAFYELSGGGGYEGLSAVTFEREAGGWVWDGVIFPGNLPPDR